VKSVRLSLGWSRLEPAPGIFDDAAFARYAEILAHCRGLELEPMIGLNHFTLPGWLADRGGWLSDEGAVRFGAYAARCGERLGAYATLWSTLNEPSVLAFMSFAGGFWPPGLRSPLAAARALRHQLLAHAQAAHALKRTHRSARVGLVINAPDFAPARPEHVADRAVVAAQDWSFTGAVLDALANARLLPPLSLLPVAAPILAGSLDWIGLNYYGRYRVHFDARRPGELFGRRLTERTVHTANADWGEIAPSGLLAQLTRLGRVLPKTAIYVTENGLCDPDDRRRPAYIADHVRAVHGAIARGVDVRGYYVWTLVDNFEWAEGWSAPFGLFALDRATQVRTARESARVYAAICRRNGLADDPTSGSPA
jgi:beta-glucosidase